MSDSSAEATWSALIVEDSATTQIILRQTMESLGFSIDQAENGEEALDLLGEHGMYDVALVDWNMPVMNGLALLSELENYTEYSEMKILMISTRSELDEMVEALTLGATDYLTKPFNKTELMEKLDAFGFGAG